MPAQALALVAVAAGAPAGLAVSGVHAVLAQSGGSGDGLVEPLAQIGVAGVVLYFLGRFSWAMVSRMLDRNDKLEAILMDTLPANTQAMKGAMETILTLRDDLKAELANVTGEVVGMRTDLAREREARITAWQTWRPPPGGPVPEGGV